MQFENIVFWSYIVLLLVGGMIGLFKGRSKISLVTSAIAAALLILTRVHGIFQPSIGRSLADVIMVILLVVFAIRLAKTKKFIPSGLMLALTVIVLVLLNFRSTW